MTAPKLLPLTPATGECCSLNTGEISDSDAATYAELFKVLADPVRLKLLSKIAHAGCAPLSVNELTELTGLSQPTVSHHLKKLVDAGLLTKSRSGRTVTHAVQPEPFARLRTVLQMG